MGENRRREWGGGRQRSRGRPPGKAESGSHAKEFVDCTLKSARWTEDPHDPITGTGKESLEKKKCKPRSISELKKESVSMPLNLQEREVLRCLNKTTGLHTGDFSPSQSVVGSVGTQAAGMTRTWKMGHILRKLESDRAVT